MPMISAAEFLTILRPWSAVAEPAYKRLGQVLDTESTDEVLWIGTGSARSVKWWAERFKTRIVGVDPDPLAIDSAERSARQAGMMDRIGFQVSPPTDLPYEAAVFDMVAINMLSLLGHDAEMILREAGRVARLNCPVVALVPSWVREPDTAAARVAAESLGLNPQLVVEWKRWFRAAGIADLSVEDAAVGGMWIETRWFGIVIRAWRVARWRGLRFVLTSDFRMLRALVAGRVLGLSIIKGTRRQNE